MFLCYNYTGNNEIVLLGNNNTNVDLDFFCDIFPCLLSYPICFLSLLHSRALNDFSIEAHKK